MQPVIALGTINAMTPTVVFTAGAGGASLDVFQLTNVSDDDVVVSVDIGSGAASAKAAYKYIITPEDNSINPVAGKLYLPEGATITVTASAADVVSYIINGIGGFFDEL